MENWKSWAQGRSYTSITSVTHSDVSNKMLIKPICFDCANKRSTEVYFFSTYLNLIDPLFVCFIS